MLETPLLDAPLGTPFPDASTILNRPTDDLLSAIHRSGPGALPSQSLDVQGQISVPTDSPVAFDALDFVDQLGLVHLEGTLRADTFEVNLDQQLTVISGNGNVDYGDGLLDYLDLSTVSSESVTDWSLAESAGVLFNPDNGARVFDSLNLSNGSQILFEGLDGIQFSDGFLDLSVVPNDTDFSEQWNLHMMGVHNAWRFTTGNTEVLVGVQDTGLGYDFDAGRFHPDLDNTLFYSDNVVDEFFNPLVGVQPSSHGTNVQSIIGAATNNGYGTSGINWNSEIFNIDVLDNNWGDLTLAEATQAMLDQADRGGQRLIINMSLGGDFLDVELARLIYNNRDNALFVIAAGNDNRNNLSQPAILGRYFSNVIAVGASWGGEDYFGRPTNPGDRISYPGFWGSNYGPGLSLMGPSEVLTANANSPESDGGFNFYPKFNGTSAATPNVAGVASLVWSINSDLSAQQVHQIMQETAFDLGPAGYDLSTGFGFVNADAAVRRAMALSRSLDPAGVAVV